VQIGRAKTQWELQLFMVLKQLTFIFGSLLVLAFPSLAEPRNHIPQEPITPPITPSVTNEPPPSKPFVPSLPASPRFNTGVVQPTIKPVTRAASLETKLSNTINTAPKKPSRNSVRLENRKVLGVHVKLVYVNLENPRVKVAPVVPQKLFKKGTRFDTMVAGSSAVALFNGGYFHPSTFSPVGDLVHQGRWINKGRLRTGLAISYTNEVKLWLRRGDISPRQMETLIGTGPLLIRAGKINPVPKAEGYQDRAIWSKAPRSAIGIVTKKKLVLVSTREHLSLRELGKIMRALGARDAIALDGGSSVGMAWKGKVLIHPKRKIAFGLGVYMK
jgi:Phosphodiester glycosidase